MRKLLNPLKVKHLELKNRIVFPPMANNFADEKGLVTEKLLSHYATRANRVGLVIVEHSYINPAGRVNNNQLGIYTDQCIEGLSKLAETIHAAGSKCGIQITHAGSSAKEELTGQTPIAPSAVSHPRDKGMPREMTRGEMEELIEEYAAAGRRAKSAGFDMVEIHGAHGYLLNQFLSPYTNKRTDAYGGEVENRMRFPLEVVSAVREEVGPEFPVFYRLGAEDGLEGGLVLEDGARAAVMLEKAGIDVLDISGGLLGFRVMSGEAFYVYMVEKIKPMVNVPVLVTGGIKTQELADSILQDNKADLIGVGRAMMADPNWAAEAYNKLK